MRTQGAVDADERDPKSYVWVVRFYGNLAGPMGRSWMPLSSVQAIGYDKSKIRERWGIPNVNSMDSLRIGLIRVKDLENPSLITVRAALPYDGYEGGAPEYFIPDFNNVSRVVVPVTDRSAP